MLIQHTGTHPSLYTTTKVFITSLFVVVGWDLGLLTLIQSKLTKKLTKMAEEKCDRKAHTVTSGRGEAYPSQGQ